MTNGQSSHSLEMLDKGDESHPGQHRAEGARRHHPPQNSTQFKTYEWLISGIFHLIFLHLGGPWVTKTTESKIIDEGGGYCT